MKNRFLSIVFAGALLWGILPPGRGLAAQDLKVPPSNRLHRLKGDRAGQYSISINDQWRICFRFIEGDAYDVEIADYH